MPNLTLTGGRPAAHPLAWDLGFLALGAILVIAGVALAGRGRTRATRTRVDVRRAA